MRGLKVTGTGWVQGWVCFMLQGCGGGFLDEERMIKNNPFIIFSHC